MYTKAGNNEIETFTSARAGVTTNQPTGMTQTYPYWRVL